MSILAFVFVLLLVLLIAMVWHQHRLATPKPVFPTTDDNLTDEYQRAHVQGWLTLECGVYPADGDETPDKLTDIGVPVDVEVIYSTRYEQPHRVVIDVFYQKNTVHEDATGRYYVYDAYWHDFPIVTLINR